MDFVLSKPPDPSHPSARHRTVIWLKTRLLWAESISPEKASISCRVEC